MLLQTIREELVVLNQALPENGLVAWTSGNVSMRDPETGYVAIKASGVKFPDLTPETMVVVDLEGTVIEGDLSPSSDTASHLVIYRHRPEINGVVHSAGRRAAGPLPTVGAIPHWRVAQRLHDITGLLGGLDHRDHDAVRRQIRVDFQNTRFASVVRVPGRDVDPHCELDGG